MHGAISLSSVWAPYAHMPVHALVSVTYYFLLQLQLMPHLSTHTQASWWPHTWLHAVSHARALCPPSLPPTSPHAQEATKWAPCIYVLWLFMHMIQCHASKDTWCHFTIFSVGTVCTHVPSLPPIPIAPKRPRNKHASLCACFMAPWACGTALCIQNVWCHTTVFVPLLDNGANGGVEKKWKGPLWSLSLYSVLRLSFEVLPHEWLYLEYLPSADHYCKSFMHQDVINFWWVHTPSFVPLVLLTPLAPERPQNKHTRCLFCVWLWYSALHVCPPLALALRPGPMHGLVPTITTRAKTMVACVYAMVHRRWMLAGWSYDTRWAWMALGAVQGSS